ncbi:hypothetical protein [Catellatospora tritici]|uniref:hypothetical protein n=1 Tax=Catellatospora tritici TaxID=2851566 RepID=UPI001C2CE804|nr:hypothetical protein [Catellatospora tritici]MBV1856107.1 hypothetical protein [Catellatospora tritici]
MMIAGGRAVPVMVRFAPLVVGIITSIGVARFLPVVVPGLNQEFGYFITGGSVAVGYSVAAVLIRRREAKRERETP